MNSFSVLMYHDLYDTNVELEAIPLEDRPYAVKTSVFREHLMAIRSHNLTIANPEILDQGSKDANHHFVILTFDDGHNSFYTKAFPILDELKLSAIFFITSDLVSQREDFCSWDQLREMSNNGMFIHAHGKTHRFISNLETHEATDELVAPIIMIESEVMKSVWSMSFPGGRYSERDLIIAKKAGYRYLFTSDIGKNDFPVSGKSTLIKRFAIKNTTDTASVVILAKGEGVLIMKLKLVHLIKTIIKRILGNIFYHKIYKRHASR